MKITETWLNIRKRRAGRVFIREYKKRDGFQILIYGRMWISVVYGNYKGIENKPNCEYFDEFSVLWTECGTMSFLP